MHSIENQPTLESLDAIMESLLSETESMENFFLNKGKEESLCQ